MAKASRSSSTARSFSKRRVSRARIRRKSNAIRICVSNWATPSLARLALKNNQYIKFCLDVPQTCVQPTEIIPVPTGYFNFVREASKWDAYVYSLFPKSAAEAYLSKVSSSFGGQGSVGATNPVSGMFSLDQNRTGYTTDDVLVGYGDGQGSSIAIAPGGNYSGDPDQQQDRVRFGWITEPATAPLQGSELVLLSVPAWSDQLTLTVTVGWMDRGGTQMARQQTYDMVIKVPTDYEAFDTFMGGEQSRLAPRISDDLVDDTPVQACKAADIIIPGYRLWRSTVVTLGGQTADRIVVLPDMQGLVAHFNEIAFPNGPKTTDGDASAPLRVWTSEGEASAARPVRIGSSAVGEAARSCPDDKTDSKS